jgi:hypothetical protein
VSDKPNDTPDVAQAETPMIQEMIGELKRDSPPELPRDDDTPPPRGPIHPPQPVAHDQDAVRHKPDRADS